MDQDLHMPTLGVGGNMHTFRTCQNFKVNDPRFYKDRCISSTNAKHGMEQFLNPKASKTVRNSFNDTPNLYIFLDQAMDAKTADLSKTD